MRASTGGLAVLGSVLKAVAEGRAQTVASVVKSTGCPRSSVFAAIRLMESEGLVERDGFHRVLPGTEAARLGFAFKGISRLARAAPPLLTLLRDDTNASVELLVRSGGEEEAVVRRRAVWDTGQAQAEVSETHVHRTADGRSAMLRARAHPETRRDDLVLIRRCLEKVASALRAELRAHAP